MKNYLITGGAGFIGSHLADKLLNIGHQVTVIDNFNSGYDVNIKENNVQHNLSHPNYKLYRADIEDISALRQIFTEHHFDAVIHLAARAGVRDSITSPEDYIKTNILGTLNLLECLQEHHCPKLVIASSSSVYGNCRENTFTETLSVNSPISPYAMTKLADEQLCYTYHHLYGINVVALRFFTVYGPRQRPDLAIHKFVRNILDNEPIEIYGDGSTSRDYTYIDDIISGIISAIEYRKSGYEIINLGSGNPIALNRMVNLLEDCLGKKAELIYKPMQSGDVDKTACNWQKAHLLLNYTPQTDFEDGLAKFTAWMRGKI